MAKRSFSANQWTTGTGTADNALLTASQHQSLSAGTSQIAQIVEIFVGGLASASAIVPLVVRRNSTAGATPTALASPNSDGPVNNNSAAITTVPTAFVTATTQPTVTNSATTGRLNLTFNAFGGLVRWVAQPGEEWWIVGTGNNVETSLATYTGGNSTTVSSSIIYELL